MNNRKEVIIVGGGASGLTASIFAARGGAKVTLLEQNDHTGKKIAVTGNGRCNLSNYEMSPDKFRGEHPEFASFVLNRFSLADTIDFFHETGLEITEKNSWIYPVSMQAKCVPELLEKKARSLKVKIKTLESVRKILPEKNRWKVYTDSWCYESDAVILANGSKASEVAGSDGSGYQIAEDLGHHLVTPLPALTGLTCKGNAWKGWSGVRIQAKISLYIDEQLKNTETGEVQLTEYGISGIPVFQISRYAIRALDARHKVMIKVNFLPRYTKENLKLLLDSRKSHCPYLDNQNLLLGLIPDKLSKVLLRQNDILTAICEYPLEIKGSQGFASAQICSGGIDTTEINPESLESLLHKNLYFAGEMIDIDGPCGGYNLQWAWSSGAAAGMAAAKEQ